MSEKEAEGETLMRTKSTQNMEGKNPKEKWQGLYRMFQEWKYQKAVTDASSMYKSGKLTTQCQTKNRTKRSE